MATLLLVVIYISFIGLGIPDSLFGAAWPAIYGEFSLPISFGSFVTVTISCCTVVSSVLSSRVIGRHQHGPHRLGIVWVLLRGQLPLADSLRHPPGPGRRRH